MKTLLFILVMLTISAFGKANTEIKISNKESYFLQFPGHKILSVTLGHNYVGLTKLPENTIEIKAVLPFRTKTTLGVLTTDSLYIFDITYSEKLKEHHAIIHNAKIVNPDMEGDKTVKDEIILNEIPETFNFKAFEQMVRRDKIKNTKSKDVMIKIDRMAYDSVWYYYGIRLKNRSIKEFNFDNCIIEVVNKKGWKKTSRQTRELFSKVDERYTKIFRQEKDYFVICSTPTYVAKKERMLMRLIDRNDKNRHLDIKLKKKHIERGQYFNF